MMVQISPVAKNSGESSCSLSFAQRVRAIELGAASKKTETAEVSALRDKLAQYEVCTGLDSEPGATSNEFVKKGPLKPDFTPGAT